MQETRIKTLETELAALRAELAKSNPKNFKKNSNSKLGIQELRDN